MKMQWQSWCSALLILLTCSCRVVRSLGFAAQEDILQSDAPSSDWGYVEVRKGAHMFWWLEPCRSNKATARSAPVVIWLQGGPGASGVGYGNFEEVGPYEVGWKPRKHSWVEVANMVFVDNPVGTGFSYVEQGSSFATNNKEIAADLMVWLTGFLESHSELSDSPLHIVCESYGGKMGIEFAKAILEYQTTTDKQLNFGGVALGDSWISPIDFTSTWAPYLRALSLLDEHTHAELNELALRVQAAAENGNWAQSTLLWAELEEAVERETDNVDFYNVLRHNVDELQLTSGNLWLQSSNQTAIPRAAKKLLMRLHEDPLAAFMNGPVRERVGIIPDWVLWGGQAAQVFEALAGDFMVASIQAVSDVLESGAQVTVYNGQLDLICCTLGVDNWLDKLSWSGSESFQAAKSRPLYPPHDLANTGAFMKSYANLHLYVIMQAGHMVPADQPVFALDMLQRILGLKQ